MQLHVKSSLQLWSDAEPALCTSGNVPPLGDNHHLQAATQPSEQRAEIRHLSKKTTVSHAKEGETSSLQSRCSKQPEFTLWFLIVTEQGNHLKVDLSAPFGNRHYQ